MSTERKIKNVFVDGAISPEKIATDISQHQHKTGIGAHDIFLGQVRADVVDGKTVTAIEYTAYEEMANAAIHEIRVATFARFDLSCMHIHHSLGKVSAGQICLFVFVSSAHRRACIDAVQFVVEEIKAKAPIFGKEIFDDQSHVWKKNT